jgi:hypothetical protein
MGIINNQGVFIAPPLGPGDATTLTSFREDDDFDGNEKQVSCETVQEFMNVLDFVRSTVDENTLSYANPL